MKKKVFTNKLAVSKSTIASLNSDEMYLVLAGNKTEVGETCVTDAVCCPNGTPDG